MSPISRRTAELALPAIESALQRARRNGLPLPDDLLRARRELRAAAVSPERQNATGPDRAGEAGAAVVVGVREAAQCFGRSTRTIERWAATGKIPATRVGRQWVIHLTEEQDIGRQAS